MMGWAAFAEIEHEELKKQQQAEAEEAAKTEQPN